MKFVPSSLSAALFAVGVIAFGLVAAPVTANALELPDGWEAGGQANASSPSPPACCALGSMHPCCLRNRLNDKSQPHTVSTLIEVDLTTLPVLDGAGCGHAAAMAARKETTRTATQPAADYGLRVFIEGRPGDIRGAKTREHIRMVPDGVVGGIDAENAGLWSAGSRASFSELFSTISHGVSYGYGAPWKRVDDLAFTSLAHQDGGLYFRHFEGVYDMVTGQVGARCSLATQLAPLMHDWIFGFIADDAGRRALHLVMPNGTTLLHGSGSTATTFVAGFRHHILSLHEDGAVAERVGSVMWNKIVPKVAPLSFFGRLSVHVTMRPDGTPEVLVAR